jgi:hypothetical protein
MDRSALTICFSALLLLFSGSLFSQDLDNIRTRTIDADRDTLFYDTLATVTGSMEVTDSSGREVTDTTYHLLSWESKIILAPELQNQHDQLFLKYRVLPASLSERRFHKDIREIKQIPEQVFTWQKFSDSRRKKPQNFPSAGIIQSGSISRGLSMGNNQDAVVNSGMDLQLSGSLGNMQINGVLSDRNIPIQPDGTTQKIHELDRVYLQVYNDQTNVTGGDFEMAEDHGYFMKINKKVQGARVTHKYQAFGNTQAVSTISGAISQGKHCIKNFSGEEGNQGPYRLTGCDGETHIIVLSGSEKVYIDGQPLKRGRNNDYVINYNTAEITFTANQPITKDKRIQVEFEYSLREYNRFMAYTHNRIKTDNGSLWFNVFSQQDSKRQTVASDLSSREKQLLARAGDDAEQAVVPYVDTSSYQANNNQILYVQKDTVVGGKKYTIYQYSSDRQEAQLEVGFSYAGKNNGHYVVKKSAANGRVYQWVAPSGGVPQGSYTPKQQLIPPRKEQMMTFGGSGNLTPTLRSSFELAMSNNDLNTFSSLDQSDNKGYALHFDLHKQFLVTDTSRSKISTSLSYRGVHKNFSSVERFRAVEYERDWNLRNRVVGGHENMISGSVQYRHHRAGHSRYRFEYLNYKSGYRGYRNHMNTQLQWQSYHLDLKGNFLETRGDRTQTRFFRYRAHASKHFPHLVAGVRNNAEYNRWRADTLTGESFSFNEWKIYLKSPDSLENHYFINYQYRTDQQPHRGHLTPVSRGQDLNVGLKIHSLKNSRLSARVTYRKLNIPDTSLTQVKPEDHLIGRIEHSMRLLSNALRTSTNLEIGAGLEPRKEFTYIEVPDGQGVYTWSDYNDNGIKELDEFEKARFRDQADFLRVYRPSGEYYKTHTHAFNQTLHLAPAHAIKDTGTIARFLSRFSNKLAYRIRRKNQQDHFWKNLNPFAYSIDDAGVLSLSSNLRNTFSFNKGSGSYHLDYIYLVSRNKSLLMNGSDMTENQKHGVHLTWNIQPGLTLLNKAAYSEESHQSGFFENKNYRIHKLKESLSLRYHPSSSLRMEAGYELADKTNIQGPEKAMQHRFNLEMQVSRVEKFRIRGRVSYIRFDYDAETNTPVAYQMLRGLKPGNNATWNITLQKELYQNLDLNLNYSGRSSHGHKTVHTGQVELRANF